LQRGKVRERASRRVLSPNYPDVLAFREAQASRAALRPGARSASLASLQAYRREALDTLWLTMDIAVHLAGGG